MAVYPALRILYSVSLKQAYLSLVAITSHDWPCSFETGWLSLKLMSKPGLKYNMILVEIAL